jgi:hypothetical protein
MMWTAPVDEFAAFLGSVVANNSWRANVCQPRGGDEVLDECSSPAHVTARQRRAFGSSTRASSCRAVDRLDWGTER